MMLFLSFCLLLLLFMLPFSSAIGELRGQKDAAPLFINMDYCKEPRYFALSFKKILLDSLGKLRSGNGLFNLMLSKQEVVEVVENALLIDGNVMKHIYYVKNYLGSECNVIFEKEVYVQGNTYIGAENQLRALACDGDVYLQRGVRLSRWLDAEGNIKVAEQCELGVSTTCGQELSLTKQCSFKRLYGFPIITNVVLTPIEKDHGGEQDEEPGFIFEAIERNSEAIPAQSCKECSLITKDSLTIGHHTSIHGHVKTHGKLTIGEYVTIAGNLFAEGDIRLGAHSYVMGTVFTQGCIILEEGVTIGTKGRIKSVIGKKGIILHEGVKIYGYVMTEGEGVVV